MELDTLRADGVALFDECIAALAAGADHDERLVTLLREQATVLADLSFHVVACGEAKRGKSSLLNAIVLRPGLFPVAIDIATCAVTTLAYGETERAVAVVQSGSDGTREEIDIPLDEIGKFVTEQENPENQRHVRIVRAVAPVPALKSGMILVDTPGIGGLNPAHDIATHTFLGRADAVLFVCGAPEVLGDLELEFLQRALAKCPVLVTAIAKADDVVDIVPVVADTCSKIADRTGRDPADLVILPVSAHDRFAAQEYDDADLLERSGVPALEEVLWTRLAATVGARRVRVCVLGLMDAVDAAAAPMRVELAADDGAELGRFDAELAEHHQRAKELQSGSASWRRELRRSVDDAVGPVRRRLKDSFTLLENAVNEAASIATHPDDLEHVLRQVGRSMIDEAELAMAALERAAGAALVEFGERTRVPLTPDLGHGATLRPTFDPVRPAGLPSGPVAQPARNLRTIWRSAVSGGGILGLLGGIVGVVGGPPGIAVGAGIGGLLGNLLGGLFGWHESQEEQRRKEQKDRAEQARRQLTAMRDNARAQVRANSVRATSCFDDVVDDLKRELVRDLDRQIEIALETATRTMDQLAARRKQTADELVARRTELERLDQRNTGWLTRAGELLRRLDGVEGGAE